MRRENKIYACFTLLIYQVVTIFAYPHVMGHYYRSMHWLGVGDIYTISFLSFIVSALCCPPPLPWLCPCRQEWFPMLLEGPRDKSHMHPATLKTRKTYTYKFLNFAFVQINENVSFLVCCIIVMFHRTYLTHDTEFRFCLKKRQLSLRNEMGWHLSLRNG